MVNFDRLDKLTEEIRAISREKNPKAVKLT
jgi:hypothetical protein